MDCNINNKGLYRGAELCLQFTNHTILNIHQTQELVHFLHITVKLRVNRISKLHHIKPSTLTLLHLNNMQLDIYK